MEPEDVLLVHVLPPVGLPHSQVPSSAVTWGPCVETRAYRDMSHLKHKIRPYSDFSKFILCLYGMLLNSIISCPDTILMLCAWFYCFIPVLCLNYGLSKTKS